MIKQTKKTLGLIIRNVLDIGCEIGHDELTYT